MNNRPIGIDDFSNVMGAYIYRSEKDYNSHFRGDMVKKGAINPVELASFIYISDYTERFGKEPSGVLFNKFMIMLNRDLLKKGKDIKLAHCWYRWGDEVVSYRIRNCVRFNHDDPFHTTAAWISAPIENPERCHYYKDIKAFSDRFIKKYEGREGVEVLLDDVYREAPYEFQRKYKIVRENLKEATSNINPDNYATKMLKPLFVEAMKQFPEDFSNLEPIKENFRKAFESAIENERSINELYCMSEDFWFFFCYHLRLKCHYNVPKETLDHWKNVIPWNDEKFEWMVQDMAYKYLDGTEDPEIRNILDQRSERVAETSAMIESFSKEELEDLKSMTGRGNYQ